MSQKTINVIFVIAFIVLLAIGVIAIVKANKPSLPPAETTPGLPSPGTSGLGGAFGDILSGVFSSNWWQNIFGGAKCDPNNPGFQKDGKYNPDKCGAAAGFECDPDRPGYNKQGFPDTNCGF